MTVTLEIQIDSLDEFRQEPKVYSKKELIVISGIMSETCSKLEKMGYIRTQMSVDDSVVTFNDLMNWDE